MMKARLPTLGGCSSSRYGMLPWTWFGIVCVVPCRDFGSSPVTVIAVGSTVPNVGERTLPNYSLGVLTSAGSLGLSFLLPYP